MSRYSGNRSLVNITEQDKTKKQEIINKIFGRRATKVSEEKKTVILPEVHGYNPRPTKIRIAHQPKQVPPVKVDDVKVVASAAPRTVLRRKQGASVIQKPVDLVGDIIAEMNQPQEEAKKRKAELEEMKRAAQVKRRREAFNPAVKVLYEFPQEMLEFEREIGWA